ncbi:MAG: ribonuclease H [Desulfosalsimonas sp.]|uniref:ribonuclease HI n=1 Tax=Desulfosalsimonas sp. TaxID=3073848 RepID=UPI003970795E
MTKNAEPGWRRMRFKKNKVWVETDEQGRPAIENKRVRIKYQLDQPHEYRVNPEHLSELENAPQQTKSGKKRTKPKPANLDEQQETTAHSENAVVIYTDGASSGNPGPAGIGAVLRYKGKKREISQYIGHATNNIAELEAVRTALAALKRRDLPVRVHTDSSYVHGLLVKNWKARQNPELVGALRELASQFSDLKIIKVRGHSGVADNEQADHLATSAIDKKGGGN